MNPVYTEETMATFIIEFNTEGEDIILERKTIREWIGGTVPLKLMSRQEVEDKLQDALDRWRDKVAPAHFRVFERRPS